MLDFSREEGGQDPPKRMTFNRP